MTRYLVRAVDGEGRPVTGIDYPPGRRAHPGDILDDLPARSVRWLLAAGLIEPATTTEEA